MSPTTTIAQSAAKHADGDLKVQFTIDELANKARSVSDHMCAGTTNECKC